VSEKKPGLQA